MDSNTPAAASDPAAASSVPGAPADKPTSARFNAAPVATAAILPDPHYAKSLFETALAGARDVAFIASVFLIFAGVVFRHRYYTTFDMPPTMAEGSIYTVLLDAYNVLADHVFGIIVVAIGLLVLFVGVAAWLRRTHIPLPISRGFLTAAAAVLIVTAFPVLAAMAQDSADKQAALVRGRYLIGAMVHLKSTFGNGLSPAKLLNPVEVSVIGETDRDIFVLYQPVPSKQHPNVFPNGEVIDIPREAIDFVETSLPAPEQLSR